jgi:hypothetical protein
MRDDDVTEVRGQHPHLRGIGPPAGAQACAKMMSSRFADNIRTCGEVGTAFAVLYIMADMVQAGHKRESDP